MHGSSGMALTHQHGEPRGREGVIAVLLELLGVVHDVVRDEGAGASDEELAQHHENLADRVHDRQVHQVGLDQVDGLTRRRHEARALDRHLRRQHSSAGQPGASCVHAADDVRR